ncbi:hypothetical protein [Streptomyces sp. NPDC004528]|uniref:hypothetical protein n=1 Tax=Streptomyces sp. NPDC004528 TaxID=3154550 RepID=UPI0033AEA83C
MAQPDRQWYADGGYLTCRPVWTSSPVKTYVLTQDEMDKLVADFRERLEASIVSTNAGDA